MAVAMDPAWGEEEPRCRSGHPGWRLRVAMPYASALSGPLLVPPMPPHAIHPTHQRTNRRGGRVC